MQRLLILVLIVFSIYSCGSDDPVDPCEGIQCGPNGICVNGGCDCDEGYTGLESKI